MQLISTKLLNKWIHQQSFLIRNRFYVTLHIFNPTTCKQCLWVKRWKLKWDQRKQTHSRLNEYILSALHEKGKLFCSFSTFQTFQKSWNILDSPSGSIKVKNSRFAVTFRGISWLGSVFMTLRWFRLAPRPTYTAGYVTFSRLFLTGRMHPLDLTDCRCGVRVFKSG